MWWTLTIGSLSPCSIYFLSPYAVKFLFSYTTSRRGLLQRIFDTQVFERGRYVPYMALLLLTILCTAALIVTGYYATEQWSGKTFQELFKMSRDNYMHISKSTPFRPR
jgi:hypothetical protein